MNSTKKCYLDTKDTKDTKEDFCGACAVVPIAFAGIGATAYGTSSKGSNKKIKKILVCSGLVSIVITMIIAYYFLKNCSDCQ